MGVECMNLSVSFSAWVRLVWGYRRSVTNNCHRVQSQDQTQLFLTLTLTLTSNRFWGTYVWSSEPGQALTHNPTLPGSHSFSKIDLILTLTLNLNLMSKY